MTIAIIILLVLIIAESLYIAKIRLTPKEAIKETEEDKQKRELIESEYKKVFNYSEADALGRNKE